MSNEAGVFGVLLAAFSLVVAGFFSVLHAILDPVALILETTVRTSFELLSLGLEAFGFPAVAVVTIVTLAAVADFLDEIEEGPPFLEVACFVFETEPERSETEQTIEEAVAEIHEQYVTGEIDEIEMEQQLARALDPEFHELRDHVEEVSGIGNDLSEAIAIRFGSVDALRAADDEDLQRISGVGDQRAEAIRERV